MQKIWDDVLNMLKTPFVGNLDTIHLFYLVGILMVITLIWVMIFRTISELNVEV